MADDENSRELPPKEIHSDESLLAYLTAEPAFLGNEQLLIIGRGILSDVGDIVDLLAIDESGAVHVIFLPQGHRAARPSLKSYEDARSSAALSRDDLLGRVARPEIAAAKSRTSPRARSPPCRAGLEAAK
jgi:hypothetical protein